MLAKVADSLPPEGDFLYEPKWDGFRAIVMRSAEGVVIQSRDTKPLDRYFPELHATFMQMLPPGCALDGEIVIATPEGLDFDALQARASGGVAGCAAFGRDARSLRRVRSAEA